MARIALNQVGVNFAAGSLPPSITGALSQPEYALGTQIWADSGLYIYGQANGAIAEGYICKYVEGTFDFDTVDTTESGTTPTNLGVCVTSGGLADNYFGWFWRGCGKESVYVQDVAANVQVTTTGTAGQGGAGGDYIYNLFTNENNAAAGLTSCRASGLLSTNFTIAVS